LTWNKKDHQPSKLDLLEEKIREVLILTAFVPHIHYGNNCLSGEVAVLAGYPCCKEAILFSY
jgi:hypothetical protein